MISQCVTTTRGHPISSPKSHMELKNPNCLACFPNALLFQMCVHQTRGNTPSEQRTHTPCDLLKVTSCQYKELYLTMIRKHEVKTNIYLLIPCTSFEIPLPSTMITTNTIRFDEFSLKTFSLHLPFHRPIDSHGIACNFLTCYVQRCSSKDQDSNTDILTDLILTKCVNTLIGNPPDFHQQILIFPKGGIKV